MSLLSRITRRNAEPKNQPAAESLTIPEGTTQISFVMQLDPQKGRTDQLVAAITAASRTVGRNLQDDYAKSIPRFSGAGADKYQVGAFIYERDPKNPIDATVNLYEGSSTLMVTLKGSDLKGAEMLMKELNEAGFGKPEIHYRTEADGL